MALKDITDYDGMYLCPHDGMPLEFQGWLTIDEKNFVHGLIMLLLHLINLTPSKWVLGYYYKCPRCSRTYAKYKEDYKDED